MSAVCPISDGLCPSEYPPLRCDVPLRAHPAELGVLARQPEHILASFTSAIACFVWSRLSHRREGKVTHGRCGPASIGHHL
jgi:hypothetical protein